MDERNPLPGRMTFRLNLDSEEDEERQQQQRIERQQYERQKQQKRKRKEDKKKAREEQERAEKEEAQRKVQERKKETQTYNNPSKIFQPDSDSDVEFSRLKRKIEEMYPKSNNKNWIQQSEQDEDSQGEQEEGDNDSENDSEDEGEQSQSRKKHEKKNNKKRRNDSDDEQQNGKKKSSKTVVKVEPEMSAKQKLVQEVACRWSYALPEWPPVDYDYQAELKKRGYRSVEFAKFKFVDEVVNGLTKVYELDGFRGMYRGKLGLVNVRPNQSCPSLNFFASKTEEYLYGILKKALEKQVEMLQTKQFKQNGEDKLIVDLKRRLKELAY